MVEILEDDMHDSSNVDVHMGSDVEEVQGFSHNVVEGGARQPNKKRKSDVWLSFVQGPEIIDGVNVLDDKGKPVMKAFCKACPASLSFGGTRGTSHLKRHVIGCLKKSADVEGQSIIGVTPEGKIYHFTFNKDVARRETVRFWIVEELAFNKIGKESFHRYIRLAFGPQFKPPCRITLRNDVMKTFNESKIALKSYFQKVPGKISLTSDLWTSCQKLGYMVVTAHFISSDWTLQKRIISFPMLPCPHTGQVISEALYAELLSWDLLGKIQCLTLDNATNNDSAVAYLKNVLFDSDEISRDIFHGRCSAHVMNLIVKDGLKHTAISIDNIKESLRYIRSSAARLQKFHETCDQMAMKKKTLPIDIDTRWDSTYLMLEAALPYQKVIDMFFCGSGFEKIPSHMDWKNAHAIKEFFQIFKESTKLFSGTKYVTSSQFCYQISKIAICLKKYSEIPAFAPMYKDMKSKFNKYWKEVPLALGLASVMDPRFKMSSLDLCLDLNKDPPPLVPQPAFDVHMTPPIPLSAPQRNLRYSNMSPPVPQLPSQKNSQSAPQQNSPQQYSPQQNSQSEVVKDLKFYEDKLAKLFEVYHTKMTTIPSNLSEETNDPIEDEDEVYDMLTQRREAAFQICKSDLQRYLDEPAIKVKKNSDFNVLKWWKEHENTYPILSAMARDLLAIPVSTVPSESAFSGSERIITKTRSCLAVGTVEALVCLEDWYKAEDGIQDEDKISIEELMAEEAMP